MIPTAIQENQAINVWKNTLWADRLTPIKSMSSMLCGGGNDMNIYNNTPFFWAIENNDYQVGIFSVIGIMSGHMAGDKSFRTRGLWVSPNFRKKGLAQKLFKSAEDTAKELGCTSMWSYPRNAALHTYLKFGFNVVSDPVVEEGNIYSPHFYVKKNI